MVDRLDKAQALTHWRNLPDNQPLKQRPIPYKTRGPKYGCDGVRIDGSRQFIDSVLSHLKPLLAGETITTRLELNYTEAADRETGVSLGWVCYIRTHQRGRQGAMMQAFVRDLTGAAAD